ncbi:DUF2274 domain-containing protein [Bradyrhizobium yuanmingense]|uniref:DUF2274 domain-containing protein n=1 Tax=Bradyrhizobium yuanmingense TaxID=108015 RepID=UPI0009DA49C1
MHHALVAYAEVLARTSGEAAPHDSAKLIAPMLQQSSPSMRNSGWRVGSAFDRSAVIVCHHPWIVHAPNRVSRRRTSVVGSRQRGCVEMAVKPVCSRLSSQ